MGTEDTAAWCESLEVTRTVRCAEIDSPSSLMFLLVMHAGRRLTHSTALKLKRQLRSEKLFAFSDVFVEMGRAVLKLEL